MNFVNLILEKQRPIFFEKANKISEETLHASKLLSKIIIKS